MSFPQPRTAALRRFLILPLALGSLIFATLPDHSLVLAQDARPSVRPLKRHHPQLADAKRLIEAQRPDAAILILENFIRSSPSPQYLDQAYLLLGAALIRTEAHEEAVTYLEQLLSEFPDSILAERAKLLLASAYAELGNLDQALPLLAEIRSLTSNPYTRREALALTADLLAGKGDYLRAIQAWKEAMTLAPEDQRAAPRERIREVVMEKLDRPTLVQLRDSYPGKFPSDLATIRIIELHLARKEQYLAEKVIRRFLKQFPTHDYASTAEELLQSFKAELEQSEHILTVLFPLSGRLSRYGTESLRGVRLAFDRAREIFNIESVGLAVKDTESDQVFLRSEVYEAINQFRPLAIIGPMRSSQVRRLAELADRTETPMLTPSATIPNVQRLSRFVFSTAVTYGLQIRHMVDYAMTRQQFYRFCILYPDTFYGRELSRLFTREVRQRAGEVIAMDSYQLQDTDFGVQIRRLKQIDLNGDGTKIEVETLSGETQIQYTPGFDAIFIPGTAKDVALLSAQLRFYDIKVPLLGTNGWNSPDLLRLADSSIEGSVFVDGFYLSSPDPTIQEFVARYQRRYHSDPSLFAAQAYDAAQLILYTIRQGATSAREVAKKLRESNELPALGGPVGFNLRGILNRHLFMLQVNDHKIVPVPQDNGTPPIGGEAPSATR